MAEQVIDQFRDASNQQLVDAGDSTNTAVRVNVVQTVGGTGGGTSTVVQGTASNLNATIVGTVTSVPSGTQSVAQTGSPWGVTGTVTAVESGTWSVTVSGTATTAPTGTQAVSVGTSSQVDLTLQQVLPVRDNDVISRLDALVEQTVLNFDGTSTVINIGQVGIQTLSDGQKGLYRQSQTGASVVTDAHGRYTEAARRRSIYTGLALGITPNSQQTSPSGLILYNPKNSQVLLSLLNVGFTFGGTPPVIGAVYNNRLEVPLTGNIPPPTGTTLGSTFSNMIGTPYTATAIVYTSATFNTAPVVFLPIQTIVSTSTGVVTTTDIAATSFVTGANIDIGGLVIIPPGVYISFGQGGAAALPFNATFSWEEIPI